MAAVIALFAIVSYFSLSSPNPITGEKQRINLSLKQEIALGMQAAPQLVQQHRGEAMDPEGQALVDAVGRRLLMAMMRMEKTDNPVYPFEFTLLADDRVVNAFALPGGQTFVTRALFDRFQTEGHLAGVMGHEIGHVVHRHGAEHLATQQLTQGLAGAAVIAAGDPNSGQLAEVIGQLVNMKYGRDDELECDTYGVRLMAEAGYDPRSMVTVMQILAEAGGGQRPPEFFSTHPNPDNRIQLIQQEIQKVFPNGVPERLTP
jgi:predicted Zn-dependent protease